jgi:hypothetical protein
LIFRIFWTSNGQKGASFSIQTSTFEFKLKTWINQRMPRHYELGAPAAVGTDQAILTAMAPIGMVLTDPHGQYNSRPHRLLDQWALAVPTQWQSALPIVWSVWFPIGTSLRVVFLGVPLLWLVVQPLEHRPLGHGKLKDVGARHPRFHAPPNHPH